MDGVTVCSDIIIRRWNFFVAFAILISDYPFYRRNRLIILLIWRKAKNDGLIVVDLAIYNRTFKFNFEPENTSTYLFRHYLIRCLRKSIRDWNASVILIMFFIRFFRLFYMHIITPFFLSFETFSFPEQID